MALVCCGLPPMLIRDRHMRNGGITGLRIDITELKTAQAASQRSEERLNRAQRLAAIGSDQRDLRTGEREWSDESYRIFGVTREDFVPTQENVFRLIHPDDRPVIMAARAQTAEGICPPPNEYRILRPDGSARHLYREWELIRDDAGTPIHNCSALSTTLPSCVPPSSDKSSSGANCCTRSSWAKESQFSA